MAMLSLSRADARARTRNQRGVDVTDQSPPRDLSAAVSSERGEPDPVPRARPRIDGVARPARLSPGLDRRAPLRGVREPQLARGPHPPPRPPDPAPSARAPRPPP